MFTSTPSVPWVRELTPLDLSSFATLLDILSWARLTGDLTYAGSPAGSSVRLLGGDGFNDIDEFASVGLADSDLAMVDWTHTGLDAQDTETDVEPDMTVAPTPIQRARARTAHHAAMICSGLICSR